MDKKARLTHKKGVSILKAKIGIVTNRKELFPEFPLRIEVASLLTDFGDVSEIPYSEDTDGRISVLDAPDEHASYKFSNNEAFFMGPLVELTKKASDMRFSLWGNQGFLYRFALFMLEREHRIFNLHACALFQEKKNSLFIIAGGAGSGKTVYLLSGLLNGLKLFSTETVHFTFENNKMIWFLGSYIDNIRIGTLTHDFPQFLPPSLREESEAVWQKKVALDLSPFKHEDNAIINPEVVIIFPRVEEGRRGFIRNRIEDARKGAKAVFDNISQKLSETVILYDAIPVLSLDTEGLAAQRWEAANRFIRHETVRAVESILTNPKDCWGDLLDT